MNNPVSGSRKVWGRRRFERARSNKLWQADYKLTEQDEWMISYLGDHSRFIPGSKIHHSLIELLEESAKHYGKPDHILRIEDPNSTIERRQVGVHRVCGGNGIEHIVASVKRPSTIGKIEAFHKAYTIEASIYHICKEFVNYWNYERPQGIAYLYAADAYFRDLSDNESGFQLRLLYWVQ